MNVIIEKIISIFLIGGVGFVANKMDILPNQANRYLVDLLMLITTPCLIITSLCDTVLTEDTLTQTLQTALCSITFFLAGCLLSYLFCVKILHIKAEEDAGVYMLAMTTVNNGFMGFPITYAIFGDEILFYMVIFQVTMLIYSYSIGMIQVNYGHQAKSGPGSLLKSLLTPCTISAIIGIFLLFTQIKLPTFLFDCLEEIGSSTVPLSMIVVGMQLGNSNLSTIVRNRKLIITAVVKMLAAPLLTFLAVNWLPLPVGIKIAMVFGATFPSAVLVVPIATMTGRNAVLAAEGVALTTTLSIFTLPACALLLSSYYG